LENKKRLKIVKKCDQHKKRLKKLFYTYGGYKAGAAHGLVQLAAVWCAGEPAEEGAVCAERCCSSAHQHTVLRPHHSGFVSTPLAASTETWLVGVEFNAPLDTI